MDRLRPRLTFANVTSLLALFVALGGTGYAALKLPRNSVGSKQIRTGAVKHKEIARNAVTGAKVKNRSLSNRDIAGKVRSARHADTAGTSNRALNADQAGNSTTLDGRGANAFLGSNRMVAGSGVGTATDAQQVLSLPLLKADITTDGDADPDFTARFVNHQSGDAVLVMPTNGGPDFAPPGGSTTVSAPAGQAATFVLANRDHPGPVAIVSCAWFGAADRVQCIGQEIPAG